MVNRNIKFGFNHMVCPSLTPDELVDAAVQAGAAAIELRNDIGANSLSDVVTARRVGAKAVDRGLAVRSINALYPFNVWNDERARQTESLAKLDDPIIVVLTTKSGVHIDGEVFVNCRYGYDIQCQVVGEEGVANLPEPESVLLRQEGKLSTSIGQDWKMRFIDSYDVELQDWIGAANTGKISGPNAWDGYFAAVTADACLEAKRTGASVSIVTPPRPAFYD